MQKEELLDSIRSGAGEKLVTREEVANAFDEGAGMKIGEAGSGFEKRINFSHVLYYIGGFIVFLGIAVLIGENWETLGTFARILSTFGSGIVAYVLGAFLFRDEKFKQLSIAFNFIAALVLPVGLFVVFDSAGYDVSTSGVNSVISVILMAAYLASYFAFKRNLFIIFSIFFGTWFFYAITAFIFGETIDWERKFGYLTLIVGASYLLLGHYFSALSEKKNMSGTLFNLGSLFILGAAFGLGEMSSGEKSFWEVIYPAVIFGIIYLGIYLKRKSLLFLSSLFLMIYILKLTGEYFADSLGWPLALVVSGLVLIFVGYYTMYLNKKYIKQ